MRFVPAQWANPVEWMRQAAEAINGLIKVRSLTGTGTPEGKVSAPVGTLYLRSDGGTGTTLYIKESGTGSSGWVAK